MAAYGVRYKMHSAGDERLICIPARSKAEAYDKAVFEYIPAETGETPYSAWVTSVTYQNGNYRRFNTSEGNAY